MPLGAQAGLAVNRFAGKREASLNEAG